jgi:diguanylate cyclase (GGDEF)-like protein/PAS domain S-box-containing protein
MRRTGRRRLLLGLGLVVWLLAVGATADAIHGVHRDSRRQLEQRFEIRADIAARFVATYAREIIKREQEQAAVQLTGERVTRSEFEGVVAGGGYHAAVLTDARGRVLQIAPRKPSLLGDPLGSRYEHLRSAVNGKPAVSKVVSAPASGSPIVAFATPFDTPQGRRVFSGAFDVERSPLAAYLASVGPIQASAVELVDPDGAVVASGRRAQSASPLEDARAGGREPGERTSIDGEAFRIAERRIAGTPWRLLVAAPEARLYSPLSAAWRWMPWTGLVLFVLASLLVAGLFARLLKARTALVADNAKRERVELELRDSRTRFRRAFDEAPIGMALVDLDGKWRQVNRSLCKMLRYSEAELLVTTRAELTHPDDLAEDLAQVAGFVAGTLDHSDFEKRFIDSGGDIVWTLVSRSLVRDAAGEPLYFVAQIQDTSERRQFEAKLSHLADHDSLSGLFNRRRFEHELSRQLAYTERYGTQATVLMLDLDNFKYVNDTLGHATGDELLVRVSTALVDRLRDTDIVARLGGDEFAIILPETSVAAAEQVAGNLLEAIRHDGVVLDDSRAIQVTASIGIAVIEARLSLTPAELMINADIAMYAAKEAGRSRFAVFDAHVGADRLTERVTWAERIRSALDDDGFVLYQQPILDLKLGRVTRYELLLRMVGADGEHIAPATFLYIAERFGLIGEIDSWVIRQAIALIASQHRLGRRLQLDVNLSGLSLMSPEVTATIEHELERSAIDPGCLTFEVSEAAAIVNIQRARAFAERIAELGCGFALDDFGAGFGSFYYLKHLPFDVLKIDGEFVHNVGESVKDQLVVQSLAKIATELGKQTVAEFVEDEATLELVRSYGVDFAQGYAIGRPQPVSEWLAVETAPHAPVVAS